jgi:transposase-like protein
MTEMNSELLSRLVTGRDRDGRRRYDPQAKLELVGECIRPGVSVADTALRYGINANLLRKWITNSVGRSGMGAPAPAGMKGLAAPNPFVAVRIEPGASHTATARPSACRDRSGLRAAPGLMRLQVHLPNGVWVDLGESGLHELSPLMQMLSQLPCSS